MASWTGEELAPGRSAALLGARPNPFQAGTAVAFRLARPAEVRVAVFDVTGRAVRTLLDERRESGLQEVRWDGRDDQGRSMAAGVYLYRMIVDGVETGIAKGVLMR